VVGDPDQDVVATLRVVERGVHFGVGQNIPTPRSQTEILDLKPGKCRLSRAGGGQLRGVLKLRRVKKI
jgi:hypothetical protein